MDIRGITFSIEALPVRKGQPLFLFSSYFFQIIHASFFEATPVGLCYIEHLLHFISTIAYNIYIFYNIFA